MMPEMPYDTHTTDLPPDARLLIFSDGIFEIEQTTGEMWPYSDFVAHMTTQLAAEHVMDAHLAFVRHLHGQDTLGDDFSMMDVRFPHVVNEEKPVARRKKKGESGG